MRTDGIVWLASYPKSGNTWLRSFLSAYLNPDGRLSLDALGAPISSNRFLLDEFLGVNTADLTRAEVRELLPVAYSAWVETPGSARLVKTHDAFGYNAAGDAIFPMSVTRGVIHLVRDPRDVAVSLTHHAGISLEEVIGKLNNPDAWLSIGATERVNQVPQYVADWSTHTRSWLEGPLPRITLRYEDMLSAPIECFRKIIVFSGLDLDEERLKQSVGSTNFSTLKAEEAEKGFRERSSRSTAPFFRQGRAGEWREVLNQAQVDAIVGAHGPMMRQLGYDF